ncbi:WhiB family transcriptional regulator [Isoptericola sp. NPDC056605]|uniref:WhiB family transcriptional regulator n=1 Tax=Isoptericola sp. NPDC056605 TaxID=3345876 RepID=UPI003677DBCC
MTTLIASREQTPYSDTTASMQPDPEARHNGGDASESFAQRFPIESARCATASVEGDWVPDREQSVVPQDQAALCKRCDGRATCLLWALAGNEEGYWAGTTTKDREQMRAIGREDIDTADWLQRMARNTDGALHEPGKGGISQYRKNCRCMECRSANTKRRAAERARRAAAA